MYFVRQQSFFFKVYPQSYQLSNDDVAQAGRYAKPNGRTNSLIRLAYLKTWTVFFSILVYRNDCIIDNRYCIYIPSFTYRDASGFSYTRRRIVVSDRSQPDVGVHFPVDNCALGNGDRSGDRVDGEQRWQLPGKTVSDFAIFS